MSGCGNNLNNKYSKESVLQFVLYDSIKDMYPKKLFKYFKNHKIKNISLIAKNLKTNKLDSLTFLEIDNTGKITRRTTKECTTIGCLPYMNRQVYHYLNSKINRIDVYVYKKKQSSTLSKWLNADTSALDKFDWNDYSYKNDTTFVETAVAKYKYVKNYNDDIISRDLRIKSTNQFVHGNISYSDSTILEKGKNDFVDFTEYYKYNGNMIELWVSGNDNPKRLTKSWLIDSNGLVEEINYYKEGKVISKIHLSYTFYS